MSAIFAQEMVVLFAILTIGTAIGQLSFRGFSLGAAGVLFTAMVFGHFGLTVPRGVMELGLLLFVYAVGLQAGPRFFRTFRRHGIQFVVIALVVAGAGALVAVAVGMWLELPYNLVAGLLYRRADLHPGFGGCYRYSRKAGLRQQRPGIGGLWHCLPGQHDWASVADPDLAAPGTA